VADVAPIDGALVISLAHARLLRHLLKEKDVSGLVPGKICRFVFKEEQISALRRLLLFVCSFVSSSFNLASLLHER
jgi:hypothetical protein